MPKKPSGQRLDPLDDLRLAQRPIQRQDHVARLLSAAVQDDLRRIGDLEALAARLVAVDEDPCADRSAKARAFSAR